MNLSELEAELKKVTYMPKWGTKQFDNWDKLSRFIYDLPAYEELQQKLKTLNISEDFNNYAVHRWYNSLSAYAVEKIFTQHSQVVKNPDPYDKLIDFTIQGVPFDHKTTVFPRGFGKNFQYAKQHPEELIQWLYKQQSTEGRYHTSNRLFVVLYSNDFEHWKLRAEISLLKPVINQYVENFDIKKLHRFSFEQGKETLSDIIWFYK